MSQKPQKSENPLGFGKILQRSSRSSPAARAAAETAAAQARVQRINAAMGFATVWNSHPNNHSKGGRAWCAPCRPSRFRLVPAGLLEPVFVHRVCPSRPPRRRGRPGAAFAALCRAPNASQARGRGPQIDAGLAGPEGLGVAGPARAPSATLPSPSRAAHIGGSCLWLTRFKGLALSLTHSLLPPPPFMSQQGLRQ